METRVCCDADSSCDHGNVSWRAQLEVASSAGNAGFAAALPGKELGMNPGRRSATPLARRPEPTQPTMISCAAATPHHRLIGGKVSADLM
jgi:hypothetical protein